MLWHQADEEWRQKKQPRNRLTPIHQLFFQNGPDKAASLFKIRKVVEFQVIGAKLMLMN